MTTDLKRITTPLADDATGSLRAGEKVLLSGFIYTARDAAHKRFIETLDAGVEPAFRIRGRSSTIAARRRTAGAVKGSCGPERAPAGSLCAETHFLGLKGHAREGKRSGKVRDSLREHRAVYLGATGGAGALIARAVVAAEVIAYEDLGPEAVVRLEVKDMPLFVINDIHGNDLYLEGIEHYRK